MKINKENLKLAEEMIEVFTAVGASYFTVVIEGNKKEVISARRYCEADITLLNLRSDLTLALNNNFNIHVRPYSNTNTFIQLDDCPIKDIFPFCVCGLGQVVENFYPFLVAETSPNNYQAWISVKGKIKEEIIKQLKKIYKSDPGATGSCRLAGSLNFKEKYSPNFPLINLIHSDKEAIIPAEVLLEFELDNESVPTHKHRKEKIEKLLSPGRKFKSSPIPWPFYDRALRMAPLRRDNSGVDRSQADYIWSFTALSWGHSEEEVIQRLLLVSSKAKEKSDFDALEYATKTVYSAAK